MRKTLRFFAWWYVLGTGAMVLHLATGIKKPDARGWVIDILLILAAVLVFRYLRRTRHE